jgi:hypothetical protein
MVPFLRIDGYERCNNSNNENERKLLISVALVELLSEEGRKINFESVHFGLRFCTGTVMEKAFVDFLEGRRMKYAT